MKINPIQFNYFSTPKSFSQPSYSKTYPSCDVVSFGASNKNGISIQNCLRDLRYDIINEKYKNIFDYFGIESRRTDSNRFTISHYSQPSPTFTFRNLGLDEEKLIEKIITIEGDGDFRRTSLKSTLNIRHIGGDCDISRTGIKFFPKLMSIGGNFKAQNSIIENFGALKRIEGNADCTFCPLNNLNSLEYIGGDFDLTGDYNLRSLGNVEHVGGDLYIADTNVTKAKHLKEVGGKIYLNEKQSNIFKNTLPKELIEKFVVVPNNYED